MYTVGELEKLHPNGRVNYKGDLTCADGSDISSEKALRASLELEKAMISMEQGNTSENESDIENALEDLLDAQIACNDDYSGSEEEEEEEEDEEEGGDGIPLDLSIPTHVLQVNNTEKRKRKPRSDESEDSECDDEDTDIDSAMKKKHRQMAKDNTKEESETSAPPNFR
jgi:hypothetical protein